MPTFVLPRRWYVACRSDDLTRARPLRRDARPVERVVHGLPLVLFRDAGGGAVALLDRCPHRNAPLSLGRIRDGQLECRYHGWCFDGDGNCRRVPGLADDVADRANRRVDAFPCVEADGYVWVVPSADVPIDPAPPHIAHADDPRYSVVRRQLRLEAPMAAAIENALDVPHTAFLHRGLFRGGSDPVPVQVTVRNGIDFVEAVFEGEPRPPGLAAKVLAPEGGEVEHTDRFRLPSLAEVEYRLGDNHLVITSAHTPCSDHETMLYATVAFRLRVPASVARALVTPIAEIILRQDAWILRRQADNIERFGEERFTHTPIDVLGPRIVRMLRRAEAVDAGVDATSDVLRTPESIEPTEQVTLYT